MARHTIALRGCPIYNEDGAASEAITPGHLVKGVTSIAKHATAAGAASLTFAMERDEMGGDVDDAYASGDYVKVGAFFPGMVVYAFLGSGQNVSADDFLESMGNGCLRKYGSGVILARALEAVNNSGQTTATRIRAEVM